MQWYEIMLIVLAAGFVAAVGIWQIVRKIKGKGGCDCGSCGGNCPHCASKKTAPKK